MSKKKAFLLGFCLTLAVLVPVYLAVSHTACRARRRWNRNSRACR